MNGDVTVGDGDVARRQGVARLTPLRKKIRGKINDALNLCVTFVLNVTTYPRYKL